MSARPDAPPDVGRRLEALAERARGAAGVSCHITTRGIARGWRGATPGPTRGWLWRHIVRPTLPNVFYTARVLLTRHGADALDAAMRVAATEAALYPLVWGVWCEECVSIAPHPTVGDEHAPTVTGRVVGGALHFRVVYPGAAACSIEARVTYPIAAPHPNDPEGR